MKKIVVINAGPRTTWNTAALLQEAARGAEAEGAEVKSFDLYKLEKFTGCISCFGCKLPATMGKCVCRDALSPVLEEIRTADGLILGSPNYLGNLTAAFRALYERLVFQSLTYNKEQICCNGHKIPVLLVMTSNAPEGSYDALLQGYKGTLDAFVGPTRVMVSGNTLQVSDYSRFNWTMFDPEAKKARHEAVFPGEKQKAHALGAELVRTPWQE